MHLRNDAVNIWRAGVAAVDPQSLVRNHLRDHLRDQIASADRLRVVGAGKAAAAMARGVLDALHQWDLGDTVNVDGWVNVPDDCVDGVCDAGGIRTFGGRPAGENLPTDAAARGTREIMRMVGEAGPDTLVLVLVSGGGSALLCDPAGGIAMNAYRDLCRDLSAAGWDIQAINSVRAAIDNAKAGGILRSRGGGPMHTLILSDILGDSIEHVASGPTIAPSDDTIIRNARTSLKKLGSIPTVASSIVERLKSIASGIGLSSTSPNPNHHITVLGNNAVAVDGAGVRAEQLGYNHIMHCHRSSEPSAVQAGEQMASMMVDLYKRSRYLSSAESLSDPDKKNETPIENALNHNNHDAMIIGGEPLVELCDPAIRGRGGRNQHLILSAYRFLRDVADERFWQHAVLLSGGTDGEDGPTPAAGAIIDQSVHRNIQRQDLDPDEFLRRHDAYHFFAKCDGLLITGPTGTNVCDIRVGLIDQATPRSRPYYQ